MVLRPMDEAKLNEGNKRYADRIGGSDPVAAVPPKLRNFASMYGLNGDAILEWNGLYLPIPPIPFTEGAQLHEMRVRLEQIHHERKRDEKTGPSAETDQREGLRLLEERIIREDMVATFKKLVRHRRWYQRLAWKVLPNPFRQCSEREMVELLAFFLLCRTKSRIRPASSPEQGKQRRSGRS